MKSIQPSGGVEPLTVLRFFQKVEDVPRFKFFLTLSTSSLVFVPILIVAGKSEAYRALFKKTQPATNHFGGGGLASDPARSSHAGLLPATP